MLDARMIYFGMAKPEKSPSEMDVDEWAFFLEALNQIRKEEKEQANGRK
jgi:hypothetical protein